MADVKWIKINVDIFDDEKFSIIDSMPEADAIEVMWFKLLVFAGRSNNNGIFFFNDHVAYTDEMLASVFRRPLNTVRLALNTFMNLGMIEEVEGVYTIPNWGKYQSLEAYERKKIRDAEYSRKRRAKIRALVEENGKYSAEEFESVKNHFGNKCAYCGSTENLTPNHVVPVMSDGSTNIANIIPCCKSCNSSKGGNEMESWYRRQPFFSEERLKFIKNYLESADSRQTVGRLCSYSNSNSNNTSISDNTNYSEIVINIINYLNDRCNTHYKSTSKDTVKHIKARLNDGFTEDDFYTVIDKKADEWIGTEQEKFLRPMTLFGTKFESYLNQNIVNNVKHVNRIPSFEERLMNS